MNRTDSGVITTDQYHRLAPDQQQRYANPPNGEWRDKSTLDSAKPGNQVAGDAIDPAKMQPGQKHKFTASHDIGKRGTGKKGDPVTYYPL